MIFDGKSERGNHRRDKKIHQQAHSQKTPHLKGKYPKQTKRPHYMSNPIPVEIIVELIIQQ